MDSRRSPNGSASVDPIRMELFLFELFSFGWLLARLLPLLPILRIIIPVFRIIPVVIIAILAAARLDLVKHYPQDAGSHRPEPLQGLLEGGQFGNARLGDQNHAIYHGAQGSGIGHAQDGGSVDQDYVIVLVKTVEDFDHLMRGEQLGRVGGQSALSDDGEAVDFVGLFEAADLV
jgi:hypothetical protein